MIINYIINETPAVSRRFCLYAIANAVQLLCLSLRFHFSGVMMKTIIVSCLLLCVYSYAIAQYSDSTHYYTGLATTGTINNASDGSSFLLNNALKLGVRKNTFSLNS